MHETAVVFLTALCSGLVATFVTILWQKKSQAKNEKIKIFTILMSKRYDITAEESVNALNMIDVVMNQKRFVPHGKVFLKPPICQILRLKIRPLTIGT